MRFVLVWVVWWCTCLVGVCGVLGWVACLRGWPGWDTSVGGVLKLVYLVRVLAR